MDNNKRPLELDASDELQRKKQKKNPGPTSYKKAAEKLRGAKDQTNTTMSDKTSDETKPAIVILEATPGGDEDYHLIGWAMVNKENFNEKMMNVIATLRERAQEYWPFTNEHRFKLCTESDEDSTFVEATGYMELDKIIHSLDFDMLK